MVAGCLGTDAPQLLAQTLSYSHICTLGYIQLNHTVFVGLDLLCILQARAEGENVSCPIFGILIQLRKAFPQFGCQGNHVLHLHVLRICVSLYLISLVCNIMALDFRYFFLSRNLLTSRRLIKRSS